MKSVYYTKLVISAVFAAAIFAANACSAPPSVDIWECLPNPLEPSAHCAKPTDAGPDGESSDAGVDGSNLKDPDSPGLQPSVFPPQLPNACKGECVPEATGATALDWPNEPLIVWFGSKSEVEAMKCPTDISYLKVRGFDNLVAPPAKCDACTCSANGSCTGLPTTIEIRSGKCDVSNVQTTPFDGPPNWDGSCTSVNAMAAGKLCNGVPCAQSVGASTLPGPTNESCTPMTEKPTATLDKHEWLEGALACRAKDLEGACATTPEHCVNPLPDGWLRCVARTGKHDVCPDNYNDFAPRFVYQDNPIDDRGCSACTCGTPKDGICTGSLRLYADSLCTNKLNENQIASTNPFCADLSPPGLAIGSKTFGALTYWPGTCAVTGGEPKGTVIPNDDGVSTICCRAPGLPPLPPLK